MSTMRTGEASFQPIAAGFDPRAVQKNEAGRLSLGQRLKLLSNPASYPVLLIVVLFAALPFATIIVSFGQGGVGIVFGVLIGLFLLVIVFPLMVLKGWTWFSPFVDAAIGKVKVIEGNLSWDNEKEEYMNSERSIGKMYLTKYELVISGAEPLLVSKDAQSLIPPGGPYRVFFGPLSRTAVNIEALPGWRGSRSDPK